MCSLENGFTVYLSECNGLLYTNSNCTNLFTGYISAGSGTWNFYSNGAFVNFGFCPSPTPTPSTTPSCVSCNLFTTGYDSISNVCGVTGGFSVYRSACNNLLYTNNNCTSLFTGYVSAGSSGGSTFYDFYVDGVFNSTGTCPTPTPTRTPTSSITPSITPSQTPAPSQTPDQCFCDNPSGLPDSGICSAGCSSSGEICTNDFDCF